MPELIHILFCLVLTFVLTVGGLCYWVTRFLKQPPFEELLGEKIGARSNAVPDPVLNKTETLNFFFNETLHRQLKDETTKRIDTGLGLTRPQQQISKIDAIYEAFDSGKTVEEIAQSLNHNKGEVELILNLRKHWN